MVNMLDIIFYPYIGSSSTEQFHELEHLSELGLCLIHEVEVSRNGYWFKETENYYYVKIECLFKFNKGATLRLRYTKIIQTYRYQHPIFNSLQPKY